MFFYCFLVLFALLFPNVLGIACTGLASTTLSNQLISDVIPAGFTKVYDQPYSHHTFLADIQQCASGPNILVFVAGIENANPTRIHTGAWGPASVLTTATTSNTVAYLPPVDAASFVGTYGVYWYMNNGRSFGFAGESAVSLSSADTRSNLAETRVSWHLSQNAGGYRSGAVTGLNSASTYQKVIWCGQCVTPNPTPETKMPSLNPTPETKMPSHFFVFETKAPLLADSSNPTLFNGVFNLDEKYRPLFFFGLSAVIISFFIIILAIIFASKKRKSKSKSKVTTTLVSQPKTKTIGYVSEHL